MGTEIPCTDRSPSPITPASGKICFFSSFSASIFGEMLYNPTKLKHCILCVVHELRPGDIKVVAAVGDSLTVSVSVLLLFFAIVEMYI